MIAIDLVVASSCCPMIVRGRLDALVAIGDTGVGDVGVARGSRWSLLIAALRRLDSDSLSVWFGCLPLLVEVPGLSSFSQFVS